MKKLRYKIERCFACADKKWKALPVNQQRMLTKIFLAAYALLTTIVLVTLAISVGNKNNAIVIDHIDSISDQKSARKPGNDNRTEATIKE
jgi:hypothetical protein